MTELSRRGFFGVIGAGAALSGLARPASAFQFQEASAEVKAARFAACTGSTAELSEHDKIRAEVMRLLGEPDLPAAERKRLSNGVACPLCGGLVGPGC